MGKLTNLSPTLRDEYFFYILETTLMLVNSVLWNVWNPGRLLPRNYNVHLEEDGETEITGEDDKDDWSMLAS